VLKQLKENPACAYSHLAFLKKLHNPLTDETTLGKVIQLSSIIDQFAKAVQKRNENDTRLATQQHAQAMFYEKAQAEIDRLSSQANEGNPGVENCNKNIAFYRQQIEPLENQIVEYRCKIIEEEVERTRIEE
jgi:peptidoglycan hydrolase CwlO-like protein